jgi:hypothetical protein
MTRSRRNSFSNPSRPNVHHIHSTIHLSVSIQFPRHSTFLWLSCFCVCLHVSLLFDLFFFRLSARNLLSDSQAFPNPFNMDNIEEVGMQDLVKRSDVTIQQASDYLGGESDHKEPRNASYAYTGDKGRRMNGEEPRIRVQAFRMAVEWTKR